MEKKDIIVRISDGLRVISTWPNPMQKLFIKCSHPEIIRDSWGEYGNMVAMSSLKSKFVPDSKQNKEAEEVILWLSLATKRYKDLKMKSAIRAILILRGLNHGNRYFSFRDLAGKLKGFGYDRSYEMIRKNYNTAIDDIWFNIKK